MSEFEDYVNIAKCREELREMGYVIKVRRALESEVRDYIDVTGNIAVIEDQRQPLRTVLVNGVHIRQVEYVNGCRSGKTIPVLFYCAPDIPAWILNWANGIDRNREHYTFAEVERRRRLIRSHDAARERKGKVEGGWSWT
jgi:hypothetical protein